MHIFVHLVALDSLVGTVEAKCHPVGDTAAKLGRPVQLSFEHLLGTMILLSLSRLVEYL